MLIVSKKQAIQWMVWFIFSSLLLCAPNTFCIFINESCYLMLGGSEIHPNVIWLREEFFFLFKNQQMFSVQRLPVCVSLSVFLAYLQYCGCKQTLPVCKNMNFFWSCSCFSIVWSYVRSRTSQLYHTAERMVLFRCWTCTLYSYSLKASSQFQAKHGCGITAIQTWVALRISGCIVWASAESTGAYSRELCGIKSKVLEKCNGKL